MLSGVAEPVHFKGGPGNDWLEGNDNADVLDGEADWITCGAGQDRVVADAVDTVASDCEQIDRTKLPDDKQPEVIVPPEDVKKNARDACKSTKVRGLAAAKAKKRLARAGCAKPLKIRRVSSNRVRRGQVTKARAKGGQVVLVVYRGRR